MFKSFAVYVLFFGMGLATGYSWGRYGYEKQEARKPVPAITADAQEGPTFQDLMEQTEKITRCRHVEVWNADTDTPGEVKFVLYSCPAATKGKPDTAMGMLYLKPPSLTHWIVMRKIFKEEKEAKL